MIAVQNAVTPTDVSPAMATLTFFQTFGGAIFLAIAEVIFAEGLRDKIPQFAPTVNAETIIAAGATGFRDIVTKEQLVGVLLAYAKSIGEIFYMQIGLGVVALFVAFGIGWKDIRKNGQKKGEVKGEEKV
ncbi:uncharacterized protein LDX57_010333 [Aspergillus melleus]|uniref:uncharacterized protein n=1 Tax=Aspergillus melleus TaxID=138277 RepID=UPI001E8D8670|nr:uncharacterized protein LDX57_010333 [Aspergillus melleus]KAH8432706.1 hypothetical protein LDX57_010333 [Aspergillus melleus]